eukprot:6179371-Pleurochrysis_carterae.AAC.2
MWTWVLSCERIHVGACGCIRKCVHVRSRAPACEYKLVCGILLASVTLRLCVRGRARGRALASGVLSVSRTQRRHA